jgi:hypothetical protein
MDNLSKQVFDSYHPKKQWPNWKYVAVIQNKWKYLQHIHQV